MIFVCTLSRYAVLALVCRSGSIYFLKRKSFSASNFWEISFSEIKQEKQTKLQGSNTAFPALGNTTPYVFGKINNLYTLQVGLGREKLILPAVLNGNISVSFRYCAGFSLAMLKPYYLKLIYTDYTTNPANAHTKQLAYSNADSAQFLNTGSILGAAGWSKGLGESLMCPRLLPNRLCHSAGEESICAGNNPGHQRRPLCRGLTRNGRPEGLSVGGIFVCRVRDWEKVE